MSGNKSVFFGLSCVSLLVVLLMPLHVQAEENVNAAEKQDVVVPAQIQIDGFPEGKFKTAGWPIPDVDTAKLMQVFNEDATAEIEGEETKVELFLTPMGTVFNRLSINGKVFEFLVDTDGEEPFEYAVVDTNGDGTFDLHKSAGSRLFIPKWVIRK